jgi:hypothetical protein
VGLQVVREQHRLRVLKMRASRHDRARVGFGLCHERVDHAEDLARDRARVIEQVHPYEGRDLVVAAASGTQLAAELGSDAGDERLLQSAVDVLVVRTGPQAAVGDAPREDVESVVHRVLFLDRQVARGRQRLRMGV